MSIATSPSRAGSDWRERVERARSVFAAEGASGFLRRLTRWSLASVLDYGRLEFFVRDLGRPLPAEPAPPADITLRLARPDEIDAVHRGSDPGLERSLLEERFASDDLCFVAVGPDGEIGHARWVTRNRARLSELECDIELAPGHAYMYDGYTHPSMRRRGLDGMIRSRIFHEMRARGCTAVHSFVRGDNAPGLRAADRWQERNGRVRYVRLVPARRAIWGGRGKPAELRLVVRREADANTVTPGDAWRRWFESWTDKTEAERSTGFSALPDEYFTQTGAFIRDALRLSPERDHVLDVGCDSAVLSQHVAPHCRRLVGVDFVRGLLADRKIQPHTPSGPMRFVNADGRLLPFADGTYDKVYAAGMVHTLPSLADGLAVIRELIRVTRPGGVVLLAAVPDRGRRTRRYLRTLRHGTMRERAHLIGARLAPRWLKRRARRWLRRSEAEELVFLEYDLGQLGEQLGMPDLKTRRIEFPPTYWSRDFRATRTNLLIRVPGRGAP